MSAAFGHSTPQADHSQELSAPATQAGGAIPNDGGSSPALPSSVEADPTAQALIPDRPPPGGEKPRKPRGFAAMDRGLVSEIARKGGKAAHSAGTAHEFTSEEARVAGRKGGRATHAKRRARSEAPPAPADEAPTK